MVNDFFMPVIRKILQLISNKYLVAILVFAVVVLITDHNNIFEQWQRKQELQELQNKKVYYEQEIAKTKKELSDLSNNTAALEKYAREKYFMKKDNEDIFITVPDSTGVKN